MSDTAKYAKGGTSNITYAHMVFHIYYGLHMAILWTVSTDQDYKFFPEPVVNGFLGCIAWKVLKYAGKLPWGQSTTILNPNNGVDDVFGSIPWILFVYIEEKIPRLCYVYSASIPVCAFHTILDHYCTVWNKRRKLRKMTYCFQNMRKGLSGVVH